MDEIEYRAVTMFLVLEGHPAKQIEERWKVVYGKSCPSSATINRWVREFKCGRKGVEDDPSPGRSTTSTSPENIDLGPLAQTTRRLR